MDTSNLVNKENTSNIIILTPELQYMKTFVAEKTELKNVISQQSNEIGKLLSELEIWKTKYEAVFQQIV